MRRKKTERGKRSDVGRSTSVRLDGHMGESQSCVLAGCAHMLSHLFLWIFQNFFKSTRINCAQTQTTQMKISPGPCFIDIL